MPRLRIVLAALVLASTSRVALAASAADSCQDVTNTDEWRLVRERRMRVMGLFDSNPALDTKAGENSWTGLLALDGVMFFERRPTTEKATFHESFLAGRVLLESQNPATDKRMSSVETWAGFTAQRNRAGKLGGAVELRTLRLFEEPDTVFASDTYEASVFGDIPKGPRYVLSYDLEDHNDEIQANEGTPLDADGMYKSWGIELRNDHGSFFMRPEHRLTVSGGFLRQDRPTEGQAVRAHASIAHVDLWVPFQVQPQPECFPKFLLRAEASYVWEDFSSPSGSQESYFFQSEISWRPSWSKRNEIVGGFTYDTYGDPAARDLHRFSVWVGWGFRRSDDDTRSLDGKALKLRGTSSGVGSGAAPRKPQA